MSNGRAFGLPALLVILPFVFVRLPYWWGHGVPSVQSDTTSYFEPIVQALDGVWPTFTSRPPGYPLFLFAVTSLTKQAMAIVAAQQIVSLACQLWLVSGVYGLRASLAPAVALATAVSAASFAAFEADTTLLSDSLYTSCLLAATGFILRLFRDKPHPRDFLGASLSMVAAILTRPAGLFLVGTWLLLLLLFWLRGTSTRAVVALAAPFPAVLLGMCGYNFATVGEFSVSPWGTASLLGTTACYMRTNPAFPVGVNWAIERAGEGVRPEERRILEESWNLGELSAVFSSHFNSAYNDLLDDYDQKESRALLLRIAIGSIRARPDLYAKFVTSQLYNFIFLVFSSESWAGYDDVMARRASVLVNPSAVWCKFLKKTMNLKLPDIRNLPDVQIESGTSGWIRRHEIAVREPLTIRLLNPVYGIFQNRAWVWIWLFVVLGSGFRVLGSRALDSGASLVFAVGTIHLGAGLVVSLVNAAVPRYSTPSEFAVWVSIALAPLVVWPEGRREATAAGQGSPASSPEVARPTRIPA